MKSKISVEKAINKLLRVYKAVGILYFCSIFVVNGSELIMKDMNISKNVCVEKEIDVGVWREILQSAKYCRHYISHRSSSCRCIRIKHLNALRI